MINEMPAAAVDTDEIKMANAKERRDFVAKIAVMGAEVELEERLQNSSDVLAKGKVTKVEKDGTFEVTIEDGEVVRFNAYGICMPWLRQLQLKIDSYGYQWADDSRPILKK